MTAEGHAWLTAASLEEHSQTSKRWRRGWHIYAPEPMQAPAEEELEQQEEEEEVEEPPLELQHLGCSASAEPAPAPAPVEEEQLRGAAMPFESCRPCPCCDQLELRGCREQMEQLNWKLEDLSVKLARLLDVDRGPLPLASEEAIRARARTGLSASTLLARRVKAQMAPDASEDGGSSGGLLAAGRLPTMVSQCKSIPHFRSLPPAPLFERKSTLELVGARNGLSDRTIEWVEYASMAQILAYSVFLGVEAEYRMNVAKQTDAKRMPSWATTTDAIFSFLYFLEVFGKLLLFKKEFFKRKDRYQKWNCFDLTLVVAAVMDSIFVHNNFMISPVRIMRFLRMFRFARIFRAIRMFNQLRSMVASLMSSIPALSWALVLLTIVLYFCSLIIMQGVEEHMHELGSGEVDPALLEAFGSLGDTSMTLFKSISGGADWGDVMQVLVEVQTFYFPHVFFLFFVCFMSFAVNGVLTAVIIEASSGILSYDKDLAIEQCMEKQTQTRAHLARLFEEMSGGDKGLTVKQLKQALEQPKTQAFLQSIDSAVAQAEELCRLLDKDGDGFVNLDEFVDGLMEHRGIIATVIDGNSIVNEKITALMQLLGAEEQGYEECVCGNVFMKDSQFCRRCGHRRELPTQRTGTEVSRTPADPA